MYQTTQSVYPKIVHSIFGPGYVPESHSDQAQLSLLPPADREFYFGAILNALRSALSIPRAR